MIVVPNHLIGQWSGEFRQLYANAKLLIAEKEDLEQSRRKIFVSKAAMGDWDAIIIAQSAFAKIPVSKERQRRKIEQEIEDIENSIRDRKEKYDHNERNNEPSKKAIEDICATFDVSLSEFYSDVETDKFTVNEIKLLETFKNVPETKQEVVIGVAKALQKE